MPARSGNNAPGGAHPADLTAEWWTIVDIAAYTKLAPGSVLDYMRKGRLPAPDRAETPPGRAKGTVYHWQPDGIIAWQRLRRRHAPRLVTEHLLPADKSIHGYTYKPAPERSCAYDPCDETFHSHQRMYCSRRCEGLSRPRPNIPLKRHVCQNEACRSPFESRYSTAKFCTPSCGSKAFHERRKLDGRAARMVAQARRHWRTCDCGKEWFASSSDTRWCSNACQAAATWGPVRGRRRRRARGVRISARARWRVLARDQWTCRICGDPLNRAARAPAPDAPVIDHIEPLAVLKPGQLDGEHNWQAAHFYCNSLKQHRRDFRIAGFPISRVQSRYPTWHLTWA